MTGWTVRNGAAIGCESMALATMSETEPGRHPLRITRSTNQPRLAAGYHARAPVTQRSLSPSSESLV